MKRQRGISLEIILIGVAVAGVLAGLHFWQVSSLKDDITDLTAKNAVLEKAIGELKTANVECKADVETANARFDALKTSQDAKSAAAEAELAAAKKETEKFKSRADALLHSKPSQPGKPCESLKDKFDEYLKDRRTRAS